MSREGPRVTLQMSCMGCVFEREVRHWRRDDPATDVYCSHPELKEYGLVGDSTWNTPSWCPLRDAALERVQGLLLGNEDAFEVVRAAIAKAKGEP